MRVQWLQAGAWWGLLALAVPLLIHLLVRQESRRLLFPSLRFLRTTPVASWRRRFVSDWILLAVRMLVLVAAVAALAAPIVLTSARRTSWRERLARAVVVVPAPADATGARTLSAAIDESVRRETASAAFAAAFRVDSTVGAGIRDALTWLQAQPPATRELVIVGDIRRDAITGADVGMLPADVGVRFDATAPPGPSTGVTLAAMADNGDGGTQGYELAVVPGDQTTAVSYRPVARATDWLAVEASPPEQRLADAVREAVLAEGLVNDRPGERRVTVVFGDTTAAAAGLTPPTPGSWMRAVLERLPQLDGGERQGRLVVRAGVPAADPTAVDVVAHVARTALAASRQALEPITIDPGRLAQWTRPSGAPDLDAPARDEGDRRWLWAAALALLGVEQLLRRTRSARSVAVHPNEGPEVRVA